MKIIATWDDGAAEDLRIADLVSKYNIKSIFYWPFKLEQASNLSKVKSFLTMKQCVELSKTFEVGSHGYSHLYLTDAHLTAVDFRKELIDSKSLWEDAIGKNVSSFCYPRGRANGDIRKLVKKAGYTTARNTAVGCIEKAIDPLWTSTTVHVGIQRSEYGDKPWLNYALEHYKQALNTPHSVFHLFGHSWEIERENAWEDLETLLKEITQVR
jgi:peptidoglycan/xylan/chitin deacetylase (PgdA/CDA1 family)